jgi:hypothetical protein
MTRWTSIAAGLAGALLAAAAVAAAADPAPLGHAFSWPPDANVPAPRGGTTAGAPVTLERDPSPQWQALQAAGLTAQERDRRAILAMSGTYRVTFEFVEVGVYAPPGTPSAPYRSWGTEKVYVDADEPGFVSLVHILEMRTVGKDGAVGEPIVTKHWRQDWAYEPASVDEYIGADRWRRRALAADDRRGAWSQTVYQVDESPRYASVGHWLHTASFSTWIGGDTWRPLPRREWSVRGDYQVLLGTNRHTVGPTGWLQEENNLKTVIAAPGRIDPARPYVAREYGTARYERLRGADFALADGYYRHTRAFWDRVRQAWADAFARQETVALRGPVDKLGLFAPLFERADKIDADQGESSAADDAAAIDAALADMGVKR